LKTDLRNKVDSYELYYYAKKADSTPKAIIVLDGAEVVSEAKNSGDKSVKYEFQLHVAGGAVVELFAESSDERKDWVDTLAAVINAHRKRMQIAAGMSLAAGGASGGLYNINVTEDQAQSCEAFGPGLFGAESGVATTFTIQATDEVGQPLTAGGTPFTATLENETYLYNIQVLDNDDGTYSSTYAISAPGEYSLALKLNDEYHIFGSPFQVVVEPGPADSNKSTARGDGLFAAKSMETSYFVIEARDSMSNRRTAGNDAFEVSVSGPALLKGLQDNNDGSYSCAFEVTATADTIAQVPNAVRINVKLNDRHLKGSPFVPVLEAPEGQWEMVPPPHGVQGQQRPQLVQSQSQSQPTPDADQKTNIYAHGGGGDLGSLPGLGGSAPLYQQMSPDNVRQQFSDSAPLSIKKNVSNSDQLRSPGAYGEQNQFSQSDGFSGIVHPNNSSFGVSPNKAASPRMNLTPAAMNNSASMMPPAEASPSGSQSGGGGGGGATTPGGGMSKLALASARAKAARAAKAANAEKAPASVSSNSSAQGTSKQAHASHSRGAPAMPASAAGLNAPSDLSPEDTQTWSLAIDLMRDSGVLPLFETHSAHLMMVFDAYSTGSGAHHGHHVKTLTLGSSGGQHKGALQMAIDYDVVPSFLTKKEIKGCYSVVSRMQGAESSAAVGLDFAGFIQLLGLMAVQALSKPSFQHLYPTNQAKVGVLLEMWGFSDSIKLQMVIHKA
jgi:hypothetical protein